jgi:hypothetical protein
MMDDLRKRYESMSYAQLANEFDQLKAAQDHLKQEAAEVKRTFDFLTTEILPERMAEDGFRNLSLADGGRIELRAQAYCSTRAGAKQKLFEWLIENDFEDLITEVVNPGTLKSFINEQLEKGNPIPDDEIVNYQPYTRATIVGRKSAP